MHRPAALGEAEAVLEELRSVLDAAPEVVLLRLRKLVPEYTRQIEAQATEANA
jgi:hypothetical protein